MRAIIFWSSAEYCDYATKLTIKHSKNMTRTELWDSSSHSVKVQTKRYLTYKRAYRAFQEQIGQAILGGWNVLNAYPKRETWETKRSK